ncbi:MAG TPA: T9SS type A sorting domain-containing protein [Bacteroidales bacterium]|nr:T9SS type A sorting domain-containing protein [Bacteroidales bacterium]HSA43705.1 T9SS type A sorting domain-containing protein [Bacteroidales bacterium]
MKRITLIFTLLLAAGMVFGQYYYIPHVPAGQNPGGLNTDDEYPVGGGLTTGWTVVLGPSQATPAWSNVVTIPFNFTFNGNAVTGFKVSSSGVLTFTTSVTGTAPSYTNQALPHASIPDNSVCVWGVAGTGTNDNIVTKTFGTTPNRQFWVFYTSYTGESPWQYWSFVLEETTNKIYVVDQRFTTPAATLTVGIQINATTAVQVNGSPNLNNLSGADPSPADNCYYEFIPGSLPDYDIWMQEIDLYPIQVLSNAPYTIEGTLANSGANTLNSFDLSYSVNNGAPVTANITGLNVATYGTYNYQHPQTWTPAATGTYNLKVWSSNVNGNVDQNPANDTLYLTVNVVNAIVQRLPLHEAFTSSTCAPCVAGNQNLSTIFTNNPNHWTCIKYQMSWPGSGDPYYTAEGGDRRTYYGVNSVPQLWVDGGLGINTSGYTAAQLNAAYTNPSFVNLTATSQILWPKSVNMNISINPVADISSSNLVMHVAIFEYVTHNNVGGNGETSFNYVMKKMVPDAQGTALSPLTAGQTVTQNLSYTFNGNYRLPANASSPINHAIEHSVEEFSDLGVIVWLQDAATKEVFQSCYSTIIVGDQEISSPDGIVGIFPNPANQTTNIHYFMEGSKQVALELYNMTGQKVYEYKPGTLASGSNILTIDTQDLPAGLYVARLQLGENTQVQKVQIAH